MSFDVVIGRNESDKKAFGDRGLAFIGKSFVTMGNYTSLSNPIFMDVARSHVVLVGGKRGSGKNRVKSSVEGRKFNLFPLTFFVTNDGNV